MAESELKNVPPLYGWAIGCAAGAVAFGVALVVVGIEGNGSVAIGAVVALVVGVIFTLAENAAPAAKSQVDLAAPPAPTVRSTAASPAPAPNPVATAEPAPAPPAPPAAAATAMAAVVAAPVETPAPAAAAAAPEVAAEPSGSRPQGLDGPQGEADDLKMISGVGPVIESKLHDLGVYHFWQIAAWTETEVEWVDGFLNFKGRIGRDEWIRQAREFAATSSAKPPG